MPDASPTDRPDRRPPGSRADRAVERADGRLGALPTALALAPVAALATATLWWPEHGDQALFEVAGRALDEGSVYYRDFWDIKQPGIYWFHALGEWLWPGGPDTSGLGARLLEALLAVVAAWLVLVVVHDWPLGRRVRLSAPLLALGPYLVWSSVGGVGQIEGLMTVPLLAVLALTWPRRTGAPAVRASTRWFVAGLVVGVVALLKTLYLPLVLLPLAGALLGHSGGRRARPSAAAAAGAAVPVALAMAYLASHGVLGLALHTTFVLPWQVAANPAVHPTSSFGELVRSLTNLTPLTGPLALLAVVATGLVATGRRRSAVLPVLIASTLAGTALLAVVLALPQFPTPYRLLLLTVPVGLLAVAGLQQLDDTVTGSGRRAVAAATLLTLALLTGRQVLHLVRAGGPAGLDVAARVARSDNGTGAAARRAAAQVAGQVAPGAAVYVFGDPRILLLLDARQGAEVTGWSMEMQPASVWHELARELTRSRPALVFVDPMYADVLAGTDDAAGVRRLLGERYSVVSRTADGTWYRTASPGTPLPAADGVRLGS